MYIDCPVCGERVDTILTVGHWQQVRASLPNTRPNVCQYCGVARGGGANRVKKQEKPEEQEKPQVRFDERVKLVYQETNEPAKKVKYELLQKNTGSVLASGQTDDDGLTERVFTDKQEDIELVVYRLGESKTEEKKTVSAFIKTNTNAESIRTVQIYRGRIFFDMRYMNSTKDKPKSFYKVAETQKRKAASRGFDKYRGDIWLTYEVTYERDMKAAWQNVYELQQKYDMEVQDGLLVTHASTAIFISKNAGLEFKEEGNDKTLTLQEIADLQKLKWTNSSTLQLYGCNTGNDLSYVDTATIADVFFNTQKVKTVKAQKGYSYFSYREHTYVQIDSDPYDERDIYLLTFVRAQAVNFGNAVLQKINPVLETGDLSVLPFYVRNR